MEIIMQFNAFICVLARFTSASECIPDLLADATEISDLL